MVDVIKPLNDYTKQGPVTNLPKLLPESDIPKLLKTAQEYQSRDKALTGNYIFLSMSLQLYAGLRISEVIKIRPKDVSLDPDNEEIRVVSSKSYLERNIPIPDQELSSLLKYITADRSIDTNVPYIRRHPKTLWQLYKKVYDKAGIEFFGTHQLRHTYAKRMLQALGINGINVLQILMGHKDIKSTMVYIKLLPNREEIRDAFKSLRIMNQIKKGQING